jgi:hypothetical protein
MCVPVNFVRNKAKLLTYVLQYRSMNKNIE